MNQWLGWRRSHGHEAADAAKGQGTSIKKKTTGNRPIYFLINQAPRAARGGNDDEWTAMARQPWPVASALMQAKEGRPS